MWTAVLLVFWLNSHGRLQVIEIDYGHQLLMCRLAEASGYEQPAVAKKGVIAVKCVDNRTA